uniref:Centromere protein I n=1 Tax=Scleropages formosus TaxID=113540 RepID=A0A8C9VNQ6_SCLFO
MNPVLCLSLCLTPNNVFCIVVEAGTPWKGNDTVERHLAAVERVGLSRGLSPQAVSILLEFSLSLRSAIGIRVLKFLVPASTVPEEAIIRGVSWLCVDKMPVNMQVLFVRWVLTVFDLIDSKDQLRAIYGFIFNFVTEENLVRRVLVLLFITYPLLELQTRMGCQPFLMHLLSVYKVYCPELVTISVPAKMKSGFKNHNSTWKAALAAVQKSSTTELLSDLQLSVGVSQQPATRKRKLHRHLTIPAVSSSIQSQSRLSGSKVFPLEQLRTFSQLLENLHRIELPAQMGSLLGSTVALHFLDCVRDSSAFLRLNFWLGHLLHEEFIFCKDGGTQDLTEATGFLNTLISTQCFLQEGFAATELFLYKFLNIWDGSLLRPEILGLLSNIPVVPCSRIKTLLFEPLMQLFFTSSLFFKCSVIECLTNMLLKWLTWHSVYAFEDELDISVTSQTPMNMTLSGLMDSVVELVHFVGRISTIGLQLEGYHSLLLSFTLDFYMMVSDMYLKYDLPLVLMPPAGVFYPALFATDPVNLDKLCHIMYRYRTNLMSAKNQEQKMKISRKTYHEFNQYVVSMVSCLWNSRAFQPGMGLEMDEGLLSRSGVPEPWTRFSLVYHPAFLGYAVDFHENCWPERMKMDLSSIKLGKRWDWYVEFLYCQGLQGLKEFMQSSLRRQSSVGGTRATSDSQSQPPS